MKNLKSVAERASKTSIVNFQNGRIGYILLWLMGVPASFLFVIYLIRGH